VRLHRRLGVTTIYVTHDQTEAMTLGQRVTVLNHGRIQQVAPPRELYAQPVNAFVAGFIGSPPMNFLRGRLATDGVDLGGIRLTDDPADPGKFLFPQGATLAAGAYLVVNDLGRYVEVLSEPNRMKLGRKIRWTMPHAPIAKYLPLLTKAHFVSRPFTGSQGAVDFGSIVHRQGLEFIIRAADFGLFGSTLIIALLTGRNQTSH